MLHVHVTELRVTDEKLRSLGMKLHVQCYLAFHGALVEL